MNAATRLMVINYDKAQAMRTASEQRLAAEARASRRTTVRPPRGPLGWALRLGATAATAVAAGLAVLRAS
jgi:hypothetical protein